MSKELLLFKEPTPPGAYLLAPYYTVPPDQDFYFVQDTPVTGCPCTVESWFKKVVMRKVPATARLVVSCTDSRLADILKNNWSWKIFETRGTWNPYGKYD